MGELSVRELPLFPLPDVVLFPQEVLPLHIFESRYKIMLQSVLESDSMFGGKGIGPIAEAEVVSAVWIILSQDKSSILLSKALSLILIFCCAIDAVIISKNY